VPSYAGGLDRQRTVGFWCTKVTPSTRLSTDPSGPVLSRHFYERTALVVARALLGKVLVHTTAAGTRYGRIVETEAYVGPHDLACHAAKGRTPRTEVMFGPAGHAYVYFVYGMHWCFNVVTGPEGVAAAVLVRGLEPLGGIPEGVRMDGPARLARALSIGRAENGVDLTSSALRILEAPPPRRGSVRRGPRVGVDYAGPWVSRPFRFWVEGSSGVSRLPRRTGRGLSRDRASGRT
jgi:DNA-3-methyladenine glycosylase